MTATQTSEFAHAWIEAWNAHDLEAILEHYAARLEFTSPRVIARMNRPDGTLRTKDELREYFGGALRDQPHLRFELVDCMAGVDSVAIVYRNHRGQRVVEWMRMDQQGKVIRVSVNYAG